MPEKPQKADLDPALAHDLEAGAASLYPVLVTFRSAPAAGELRSFGLQGELGTEGGQAFGELDAAAVRTLAERPDVASIVRLPAPVAGTAAAPEPASHPKLDLRLASLLAERPDERHSVTVFFHRAPSRDELLALGLGGEPPSPIASGRLDRESILALAGRDDVASIEAAPEVHLYSPS